MEFSQYLKGEFEYIKHWDLSRKKVFATKVFAGIAVPYGNSDDVPFSRSYFAGGSNDNRAWQSYGLGPGSSGSINDFNEAQKLFYKQIDLLRFIVEKGLPRAIKAGLNLQGIDGGQLRKPLQPLNDQEVAQLKDILDSLQ